MLLSWLFTCIATVFSLFSPLSPVDGSLVGNRLQFTQIFCFLHQEVYKVYAYTLAPLFFHTDKTIKHHSSKHFSHKEDKKEFKKRKSLSLSQPVS